MRRGCDRPQAKRGANRDKPSVHHSPRNPLNRFLISIYQPEINFVLRFQKLTIAVAVVILIATACPASRLGSEFLPNPE